MFLFLILLATLINLYLLGSERFSSSWDAAFTYFTILASLFPVPFNLTDCLFPSFSQLVLWSLLLLSFLSGLKRVLNMIMGIRCGLVLWHVNHFRLFYAKPFYTVTLKVVWSSFVWFYGILIIVGYLMPNPLYTYLLYIYMIWFGLFLWYINECRLFNAKFSLYIYINLVWFCGIPTIVGYLMPNPLYTYILFGLVLWHINYCRLFNAKSSLYIYNFLFGFMAYQPLLII